MLGEANEGAGASASVPSEGSVYVRERGGPEFTREQLLNNFDVLLGRGRQGGLRVVPDSSVTRFAIFCDKCGSEITDGHGVVIHTFDLPGDDPRYSYNGHGPAFFHKRRCDVADLVFGSHCWDELADVLVYIANNCGVDLKQAQRHVRMLAEYGL